ncbi:MAG: peptidase T [Acholeplasmataceae bacterium]|nr:peptidase T [Acholeplasmataceae bacterium]
MKTVERFLKYIKINTISDPNSGHHPSTEYQWDLARLLVSELEDLGIKDIRLEEHCYVYANLPANTPGRPTLAFIAHLDTSPDLSGKDVQARLIPDYDGGDVRLTKDNIMRSEEFPFIKDLQGQTLIVTDGTTLLGADDKAGIAEIMTMLEYLLSHPEIKHGDIKIIFTPDEEIGEGPLFFDYDWVKADYAYTVDGGKEGVINYENFNAAAAVVQINGVNIHPGSAKNHMKNSLLIGMEFNAMLPATMIPAATEKYEGFFHLNNLSGDVERTKMHYLIRNHDMNQFQKQKELMYQIRDYLNAKYGPDTIVLSITDSYFNMKEILKDRMEVVHIAEEATRMAGLEALFVPIRGGTDGAQITYKGLPCPNLGTGGWSAHGRYECVTVEALDKCTEVLINIVRIVGDNKRPE